MFTGIVECVGEILEAKQENNLLHLAIQSEISCEFTPDQSVAHNGMCLTVTRIEHDIHYVTLVAESLRCSDASKWTEGRKINLERSLTCNGRLDGHFVTGHVDTVAGILDYHPTSTHSKDFIISLPAPFRKFMIPKGSVCVDGVSLTVAELGEDRFRISIIPYTLEHTTFSLLKKGDNVHLEFDLLGKYVARQWDLFNNP